MDDIIFVLVIGFILISPFIIRSVVTIASAAYFKQKLHYHKQVLNNIDKGEHQNGAQ
jgi:hypothetical protein